MVSPHWGVGARIARTHTHFVRMGARECAHTRSHAHAHAGALVYAHAHACTHGCAHAGAHIMHTRRRAWSLDSASCSFCWAICSYIVSREVMFVSAVLGRFWPVFGRFSPPTPSTEGTVPSASSTARLTFGPLSMYTSQDDALLATEFSTGSTMEVQILVATSTSGCHRNQSTRIRMRIQM